MISSNTRPLRPTGVRSVASPEGGAAAAVGFEATGRVGVVAAGETARADSGVRVTVASGRRAGMGAPARGLTGIERATGEIGAAAAIGAAGELGADRDGFVSGEGASVVGARRTGAGGGVLRAGGATGGDGITEGAARGGSDGGAFLRGGGGATEAGVGANSATDGGATDAVGGGGATDAVGGGGATDAVGGGGVTDAVGGGGVTDAVGGGGVIDDACCATSAAALNSVSARTSSLASDACSAARRSHFNASVRSPRPHSAPAVERAQLTSSSSFGSGFGIGERASIWLPGRDLSALWAVPVSRTVVSRLRLRLSCPHHEDGPAEAAFGPPPRRARRYHPAP
jgi:hypothetical protein